MKMFYDAKSAAVEVNGNTIPYIRFGSGKRCLIMLPGLGDSLRSIKGMAIPLAWFYRRFAKVFTVYIFSRSRTLPQGCTTRDMARELGMAMTQLGIGKADVFGVSMGGMIAQHLAIDYPEKVGKLILSVTAPGPNPVLRESVERWIGLARQGAHRAFMKSNLERIYSKAYCRRNRWLIPILGVLTKPASYESFFVQANACLTHDAEERLAHISAPTLVIGGGKDETLGAEPSVQIAEKIPGAQLYIYPQWGHGLYDEAKDYYPRVLNFLREG